MKNFRKIAQNLAMISQLGISLIMPLLICILICVWLMNRFNVGGWVFIPGFILGLGSSFTTGYKFYLSESKKSRKESEDTKASYNNHS